jgi:hypothetical protein
LYNDDFVYLDRLENLYAARYIKQETCDEAEDHTAMPQLDARSQCRRKVKEEEKAVFKGRSRSRSKSPGKQAGAEPPKARGPAEQVPKVGAKRGRPKKSPDSNESSLKRLSIYHIV